VRTIHAEIRPVEVATFAVLAVVFVSLKVIQHVGFLTNDFDTGIYSNVAWNIAHGRGRLKSKASHRVLASDPRFEVVEKDAYLEVYRWNEDAAASE
jgi:uncharacterized membrane protein